MRLSALRRNFVVGIDKTSVFIGRSCGAMYVIAIALSTYEVFARYVLASPTVWSNEIIMALCAMAWLFSAGSVTQQRRHITVTVMEAVVGRRVWAVLQRIASCLSLGAVIGLLWASWKPFTQTLNHIERSGSAFNSPLPSFLKVMIVIALLIYAVQLLANFIKPMAASETSPDRPETDSDQER